MGQQREVDEVQDWLRNRKWTRWILYVAAIWWGVSSIRDFAIPLYENILRPAFIWSSGIYPNPDDISYERHAFLAGYEIYHLYRSLADGTSTEWPAEFSQQRNRLEASLISLGVPNANLVQEIDPENALAAFEKYQRLRSLTEAHLDKIGESRKSSFFIGLDMAILMEQGASESPSQKTMEVFSDDLKDRLKVVRGAKLNRLPALYAETISTGNCCNGLQKKLYDSYVELKKFYGIASG